MQLRSGGAMAVAPFRPLAQELPYASGVALKGTTTMTKKDIHSQLLKIGA